MNTDGRRAAASHGGEKIQAHDHEARENDERVENGNSASPPEIRCKSSDGEDETTPNSKFLPENSRIILVQKFVKTSAPELRNITANPNQAEIQLCEKENETIIGKRKIKKGVLWKTIRTIDSVIAAVIVGPMVVAHWKGIWVLMDLHEKTFTGWSCFGVGLGLHLFFAVAKQPLHKLFAAGVESKGWCARFCHRIVRTLYIYAFSVACNSHWRGAWIILRDWFGEQAVVIGCFTCAALGNLLTMRCSRNLLAPPFYLIPDSPSFVFRFPTKYRAA